MNGRFRIVALWCWYRGARFHGYQRQQAEPTVQGTLLDAFASAGLTRNPVVAGRTDRGVSARMQVLSARLEREVTTEAVRDRLNARLPGDLGIHLVREAKPGFHAAWSSVSKEYRYQLAPPDFGDRAVLAEVLALIPGKHNFNAFHFKTSAEQPRTVTSAELIGDELRFIGEGFARHMVRMLVGAATAVARGELTIDTFRAGLREQRNFHCPTAAPEPLTLWSIGYPPDVDPFSAEDRAGFSLPSS
jgi:tRNA pseudouridine38-40 synthase